MEDRLTGALRLVGLALAAGLCLVGPAGAQVAPGGGPAAQPPAPGGEDRWRLQVTPYLWMSGFGGELRPSARLPAFRVSESFGDILSDLDAGIFLNALAIRDRLVLAADLSYVATSRKGDLLSSPPVAAKGSLEQFSMTLLGGYRALRQPGFDLDLLAGFRAWSIDADVELRVAGTPLASQSASVGWVDPILAVRARGDLAPRLSAHLIADIGGFGVGSRFTWQLAGLLNYQVSDDIFVSAGYRHLAADYRDGPRRLDFNLSGPVLGVTWRF
ncbi:hypothetical protein [Falsiroseomonas sp. CW058]|uniref:hypothetical protein n=1 Tax=Falsiroseomonas sp. CW058 TaxID=3388664 RepID=UPI003D314CFF